MGQRGSFGQLYPINNPTAGVPFGPLYDVLVPNKESEILTAVPGINEVPPVGWCTRRFPPKLLNWDKTSKLVKIRGWLIAML
jgi:hypothetical protein